MRRQIARQSGHHCGDALASEQVATELGNVRWRYLLVSTLHSCDHVNTYQPCISVPVG